MNSCLDSSLHHVVWFAGPGAWQAVSQCSRASRGSLLGSPGLSIELPDHAVDVQSVARTLSRLHSLVHLDVDVKGCWGTKSTKQRPDRSLLDGAATTAVEWGSALTRCATLQRLRLNLACTGLNDAGVLVLFSKVHGLPSLQSVDLDLSNNSISPVGVSAVCTMLHGCHTARKVALKLQSNKIRGLGACELAAVLPLFTGLEQLSINLDSTEIGDDGAHALGRALTTLPCLRTLDLDMWFNDIGDAGVRGLVAKLPPSLQHFRLAVPKNKRLGDSFLKSLGSGLLHCPGLRGLDVKFASTFAGNDGLRALSSSIGTLLDLRTLSIDCTSTRVGNAGIVALGNAMVSLQHLASVSVFARGNLIADSGISQFVSSVAQLNADNLQLDFQDNIFTQDVADAVMKRMRQIVDCPSVCVVLGSALRGLTLETSDSSSAEECK